MLNPFSMLREARRIEKEVSNYVKEHPQEFIITEEQFKTSLYPSEICDVCNNRGSEMLTDTVAGKHYYHNKCFALINKYSQGLLNKIYGGK
jgi:hypothetical protein